MNFDDWKSGFRTQAIQAGIARATWDAVAPYMVNLTTPTRADTTQAEARKTLRQYLALTVSDKRVSNGIAALTKNKATFDAIETNYGVDRHIVAAIWGLETNYGAIRGDINVIAALATLSAAGRRRALFESQLIDACKIVEQGVIDPKYMIGSWAGAMGHTQFMPSSYLNFAVAAQQGTPNFWTDDPADGLTSTAHYLICHGWTPDLIWGAQAHYPNPTDLHHIRHAPAADLAFWTDQGVVADAPDARYRFCLPAGVQAPAFLITTNFDALLKYNNANAYAVAVGHLADRLAGTPPLTLPDVDDIPALSAPQMQNLQTKLTTLGFDTQGADGFPGPNTEIAIEAYQKHHNLPVDGYPNLKLLTHISSFS